MKEWFQLRKTNIRKENNKMKTAMNERIELNTEALSEVSGGIWEEDGHLVPSAIKTAKGMIDQFKKKGYTCDRFLQMLQRQNHLKDDDVLVVYIRTHWDTI